MLVLLKLLSQLVYPLLASLLLALWGGWLLWRHQRRSGGILLALALSWLWLWSTPVFGDWLRATLEQRYPPALVEQLPSAEAIVVLGGGMEAAHPPERLYPNLNAATDRAWYAARLFRAGKAPLIVATGGTLPWSGIEQPEAEVMMAFLQELGVPQSAIVLEANSRTTEENRDNTLPILHKLGIRRILLVTSALHMPRALGLFKTTNLDVIPAPTDFEVYNRSTRHPLRWLPDAQALADSSRAFKEYLGRWVNALQQSE
jgi:uncharacterized SAM-binding protein YcdF (DUF218 family)